MKPIGATDLREFQMSDANLADESLFEPCPALDPADRNGYLARLLMDLWKDRRIVDVRWVDSPSGWLARCLRKNE